MSKIEFIEQTFKAKTLNEQTQQPEMSEQTGLVCEPFGFYEAAWVNGHGDQRPFWSVTHLPTGLRTYSAASIDAAKQIIKQLLIVDFPWFQDSFADRDRARLYRIHNELCQIFRTNGWLSEAGGETGEV